MEWNTIPAEILEQILSFNFSSPESVANASQTCKNWSDSCRDPTFCKDFFSFLNPECQAASNQTSNVDWQEKLKNHFLVRNNVKLGRYTVRTIAAVERSDIGFNEIFDYSTCKDYAIIHWVAQNSHGVAPSSALSVNRSTNSHLINMVTGEFVDLQDCKKSFMNDYISNLYMNPDYSAPSTNAPQVQPFDERKINEISFNELNSVKLNAKGYLKTRSYPGLHIEKRRMKNNCPNSIFVAVFVTEPPSCRNPATFGLLVLNGETGAIVYSRTRLQKYECDALRLYDNYLVLEFRFDVVSIDVKTSQEICRKKFSNAKFTLGQGYANKIVIRTEENLILWNFVDGTEETFPVGQIPNNEYILKYHNMWVTAKGKSLQFFDMKDGTLLQTVSVQEFDSISIREAVLLSNGCLGLFSSKGCHVLSFVDAEVNRKISVKVLKTDGSVTTHDIFAHELFGFFFGNIASGHDRDMTSSVVEYAEHSGDERFVMIYSEKSDSTGNQAATRLAETAAKPICMHSPYGTRALAFHEQHVKGDVLIVREKKIEGRWQLTSM